MWIHIGLFYDTGTAQVSNIEFDSSTEFTATVSLSADIPTQTAYLVVECIDSMCGYPVSIPVQIVNCTPTITSVSPSTWYAGKTYNPVTITGTNFITTANATTACPVSAVSVTTPSGAVIAVSNVNVVSATQITATVAPPAVEPNEIATVTVGAAPNTATATVQIEALSAKITDTSDIMNGNVTVNLTAPSGTTGDLNLNLYGVQNFNTYSKQFSSLGPGLQNLELDFDYVQPDIYSTADGQWNAGANGSAPVIMPTYTLPTPWTYFRKIRFTQYNKPHESACAGGDADAWLVDTGCNFTKIRLKSDFIAAVWLNGTGISLHHGTLQNAWALGLGSNQATCANEYTKHPGAIGQGEYDGNTFVEITSITGSCPNQTLVEDQSLAMPCVKTKTSTGKTICPASILSGVQALNCGDDLNLDKGDYTTAFTRTVDDKCPKCSQQSTFKSADGHIDAFSSSEQCSGDDVGDLGYFYTSYPTN